MRRNRGGFTILEVMIFLAISGAMLAAAMVAVKGQQNRTEFTQGMRDIDSKLQDILNDVSNGNFTYDDQDCMIVGSGTNARPQLTPGSNQLGSRSECLFLGKALQFSTDTSSSTPDGEPDNSQFAIYTVLGRRLTNDSLTGNSVSVNSFDEANPTAMIGGGSHDLTTYYGLPQGITTKGIYYTPASGSAPPGSYTLLGVYTSFTSAAGNVGNSGADASDSLQAFVYKLPDGSGYDSMGAQSAKRCIDANNPSDPTCPFDQIFSTGSSKGWGLCFDSNNATGQTALITIYNTVQGVNTRLDYNPVGVAGC